MEELDRRMIGMNDFRVKDVNKLSFDVSVLVHNARHVNFKMNAKSKRETQKLFTSLISN